MSRHHNNKWAECRTCKAVIYCANITSTSYWESSCSWSPSQTAVRSELDTNRALSSANVTSSHPSFMGASEVKKLYILQTDDLDLPTLTWKVRSLRNEYIIRTKKILHHLRMSLCRSASCYTESKAISTSKRSIPVDFPCALLFFTCLTTLLSWWEVECAAL
jgi:hypothetical protein